MIKKLQNRFTLITMLVLTGIFAIVFGAIYFTVSGTGTRQTERMLEQIAENDGRAPAQNIAPQGMPGGFPGGMMNDDQLTRHTRFIIVKLDHNNNLLESKSDLHEILSDEEVYHYVVTVLAQGKAGGSIDNYQYVLRDKDYGKIIILADKSIENHMLGRVFATILVIACAVFVALFFVVQKLSAIAIRPVKEAFERQKRFVSDASHELKTPVSIISANADVLAGDIGQNKWLQNIQSQVNRMNTLTGQLLDLAKIEEETQNGSINRFDLSACAEPLLLSYESMAFEQNLAYTYTVEPGLWLTGDAADIEKLLSVFLDNAFKYVDEGGKIQVRITRNGKNIVMEFLNTGQGISKGEQEKIFERFYRKDASRSNKTGGHGLGLAIAQSIAQKYKAGIDVQSTPGEWTRFSVTF